jgi:hypothetical protein
VLRLVADHAGEVVTHDQPLISATLPHSGERFQGVFPPISAAPCFRDPQASRGDLHPRRLCDGGDDDAGSGGFVLSLGGERSAKHPDRRGHRGGQDHPGQRHPGPAGVRDDRVVLVEDTPELQCAARTS